MDLCLSGDLTCDFLQSHRAVKAAWTVWDPMPPDTPISCKKYLLNYSSELDSNKCAVLQLCLTEDLGGIFFSAHRMVKAARTVMDVMPPGCLTGDLCCIFFYTHRTLNGARTVMDLMPPESLTGDLTCIFFTLTPRPTVPVRLWI